MPYGYGGYGGGYGGYSQLPELSANPIGSAISTMSALQNYGTEQAEAPARLSILNTEADEATALEPLKVQQAKTQSQLQQMQFGNESIAQVLRDTEAADPEDRPTVFDQGMKNAAAAGAQAAGQYIGHYSNELAERLSDVYGAPAAGGAGGSRSRGTDPASMAQDQSIARTVAGMPADHVQLALGNINKAVTGFNRVNNAQDLQNEVQLLQDGGIPVQKMFPGIDFSRTDPATFAMNYSAVQRFLTRMQPYRDALASRSDIEAVGGTNPQPAPMYEPRYEYIGTDQSTQKPVAMEQHSGTFAEGPTAIGAKPSAAIATFNYKYNFAKGLNWSDNDAAEFAQGKRAMEPAQMREAARAEATREYGDISMSDPDRIKDPQGWIDQETDRIYGQISQGGAGAGAQAPGMRGPGGAPPAGAQQGQPPARAINYLRGLGGRPYRFPNGQVWTWRNGKAQRVQ